jgi:phosphatidylserine/phosphatidylglycerophosphate/cardiolipin synthase-like enzyme
MRKKVIVGNLSVQAIAGTHVVMLGMNLPEQICSGLLGFAIRRHDHTEGESYWLSGYKTSKSVEPYPAEGVLYSTRKHPIQDFSWSDFTAKPGYNYTYEIVALRGNPVNPQEAETVSVDIKTETEKIPGSIHHVHFNRGAAASQEYTRRFGDKSPDEVGPAAYNWLSRGAAEAIQGFIERAKGPGWGLRVCAYEFTDDHVLSALKEAWLNRHVDVQILYHALNDPTQVMNDAQILKFGLTNICHKRDAKGLSLSHHKVIIMIGNNTAQAVLTGSTNFSRGGIYGHSNVVHICEDKGIAGEYLWLWNELYKNNAKSSVVGALAGGTPLPQIPYQAGTLPIFSPRPNMDALKWYAQQAKDANDALFMTFAFSMHPLFQDAYQNGKAPLRYALMEKMSGPTKTKAQRLANEALIIALRKMKENKFAIGAHLRKGVFNHWLTESLSGLNTNVRYLHTKYMLVDPLSENPLVVSGSANFSKASTEDNDENMLIIRGDTHIADIYLGEFMRMYRHFAFRDWLSNQPTSQTAKVSYLDETNTWWKRYFANTFVTSQRKYFAG